MSALGARRLPGGRSAEVKLVLRRRADKHIVYLGTKRGHRRMPFETEREDLIFTIRMALMKCRTSPRPERNEFVQTWQARTIVEHLERCGWKITEKDRDTVVKPTTIGA
jgi:hypothetical protein